VDYATNQGLDWVVLTNGMRWILYKISFKKPIEAKIVAEFDLLTVDSKSDADLEKIYILTREGLLKGAVVEFSEKQSATDKYLLAAVLLDQDVLNSIRRELRRLTDIMVPIETIAEVLRAEVLKRETLEGDAAVKALRIVSRQERKDHSESATEVQAVTTPATTQPPVQS
jgi:predicted type IV restriction endonuclease